MGKQPGFVKKHLKDAIEQKAKAKSNPFDKFANNRQKHAILNRKVKGEDRDVGRARAKAVDERKKKLLKDYHSQQRQNQIIDKRLSEYDPTMSVEEKLFMRLQKEKMHKLSKNMSKYNLDNEDNAVLTHKGQILGESNIADDRPSSDDEDDEGGLDKEVVHKLHFGGGLGVDSSRQNVLKGSGDDTAMLQKKGRLEALQEIVMKSKLHKMQRKTQKEEQENTREQLDRDFDSMFGSLDFDPSFSGKGGRGARGGARGQDEGPDELDAYDASLNAMMYEAKRQPTDRIKTDKEEAEERREKLEALEKERLLRMTTITEDARKLKKFGAWNSVYGGVGDGKEGSGAVVGSRKRGRNDDDLDDWDNKADDEEQEDNAEREDSEESAEEEDFLADDASDEEESEDDESGEEGEGSEEEGVEWVDEDDEDGEEGDEDEEDGELEDDEDDGEDEDEDDGEDDEDEEDNDEQDVLPPHHKPPQPTSKSRRPRPLRPLRAEGAVYEDMPHTPPLPSSRQDFVDLLYKYCQSAATSTSTSTSPASLDLKKVRELLSRIKDYHAPAVSSASGVGKLTHIVVMYLLDEGAEEDEGPAADREHLDFLAGYLFDLFTSLPDNITSPLSTRILRDMVGRWESYREGFVMGKRNTPWPPQSEVWLVCVLGKVFSSSDLKHEILDPTRILLSQTLSHCTVSSVSDLFRLISIAGVFMDLTKEGGLPIAGEGGGRGGKVVPELGGVVAHILGGFAIPPFPGALFTPSLLASSFSVNLRALLAQHQGREDKMTWDDLYTPASTSPTPVLVAKVFTAMLTLATALIDRYASSDAFPELTKGIFEVLTSLRPHSPPHSLPLSLQKRVLSLLEDITSKREEVLQTRKALAWRPKGLGPGATGPSVGSGVVEMKTPRYEVNYIPRKDHDANLSQERVKLKQLTRELKREKRAAVRELKRDASFLDNERYAEQQKEAKERREERHRNFHWMEEEAATVNQQVRKGKGLMEMKGGGTGHLKHLKNKRVKR
eukprot:gene29575-35700_t